MTYLDNAATSFPKPRCVISELNKCVKEYCGNPGRSSHILSTLAAEKIYEVRVKVSDYLGVDSPESIIFTPNATFGLNLAIKSLINDNCHVLCSDFEHNSVIRPLYKLSKTKGVSYSSFSDIDGIESLITDKTTAIVCSVVSNVTGETIDIRKLSDITHKHGLYLIVDASQGVGHMNFDLSRTPCAAFCAPGHKGLFGIQGSGFVYLNDNHRGNSFIEGGSGFDSKNPEMPYLLPDGYEAGTLSTPAIASLGKGIDYINKIGVENISDRLDNLTKSLYERLMEIEGINVLGFGFGILSFNYRDRPSTEIASQLNSKGICVRGGLHCSPWIHSRLGTSNQGAVRVSFSYLNRQNDVDKIYRAIKEI